MRNAYKIFVGKWKGRDHFEERGVKYEDTITINLK
jgi:hypothetical protein